MNIHNFFNESMSWRRTEYISDALQDNLPRDLICIIAEYAKLNGTDALEIVLRKHSTSDSSGSISFVATRVWRYIIKWDATPNGYENKHYFVSMGYIRDKVTTCVMLFSFLLMKNDDLGYRRSGLLDLMAGIE